MATPTLTESTFSRTVVLLLQHDGQDGALGVVLDRPGRTPLEAVLPAWAEVASSPEVVFEGGPVQPTAAVCLGRVTGPEVPAQGWAPLTDPQLGTVDLDREPWPGLRDVRVFAGYAGWSPGQLEGEVEEGAWWVVDALPGDPFTADPSALRRAVLRRQGPPLAYAVHVPDDPALN